MCAATSSREISVATIDDHAVVRQGIQSHLERVAPEISFVASSATVAEYLAGGAQADVVLLDLILHGGSSVEDIPSLVDSGAQVLMFTTEERPVPLRRAVEAGASGVLLKSDSLESLVANVRQAMSGEFCCSGPLAHALVTDPRAYVDLSDQQRQVLACLADGLDYRGTARAMGIAEGTVKTHLSRTREKFAELGLSGNSHFLTRQALDQGHIG